MSLPEGFLWGGATAANQYEGALIKAAEDYLHWILLPAAVRNSPVNLL